MNRLEDIVEQINAQSQPPVHLWHPAHHADIDISIDLQGNWFHEGEVISRDKLVALFASILWAEDGQHYLVTPVEKLKIQVIDVPFLVHQMERVDEAWVAVTNVHEQIVIGPDHPVELRQYQDQWVPYIKVRYDLWARVNRSIFYQWVTEAMQQQKDEVAPLMLSSQSYQFEVARL